MAKRSGWRSALYKMLTEAAARPFVWGQWDCGVGLAASAIEIQTGDDFGAPFRGTYSTPIGSIKALRNQGFDTLADVVGAHFERIEIGQMQFGDIAVLQGDETGMALGVVLGERIGVVMPSGYGTVPRSQAKWAYRIA